MDLVTIVTLASQLMLTAQKMVEENRATTTAEEQDALDNVMSRRASEEARFKQNLADGAGDGSSEA